MLFIFNELYYIELTLILHFYTFFSQNITCCKIPAIFTLLG